MPDAGTEKGAREGTALQLNCSLSVPDWSSLALFSLGFVVCELRKALIYKGMWRVFKTPKAGVAGSIPAGRANSHMAFSGFPVSAFPSSTVKIQLDQSAGGRLQVDNLRVRLNPAGQVIGRQVRVALHHLQRFPSSQLLEHLQRRAARHMPACPRMAQIVPAEITDAGPLARLGPCGGHGLIDRLAVIHEHAFDVFRLAQGRRSDKAALRLRRSRARATRSFLRQKA